MSRVDLAGIPEVVEQWVRKDPNKVLHESLGKSWTAKQILDEIQTESKEWMRLVQEMLVASVKLWREDRRGDSKALSPPQRAAGRNVPKKT